jgi:hypothetical protein
MQKLSVHKIAAYTGGNSEMRCSIAPTCSVTGAPSGFASVPGDDDIAHGIAEPFFALCGNLP